MMQKSIPLLISAVMLAMSCSKNDSAVNREKDIGQTAKSQIDYTSLLTRDDAEAICAERRIKNYDAEFGAEFLPDQLAELTCSCQKNIVISTLQAVAPNKPRLHTAVAQVTVNPEVLETIMDQKVNPDGFKSLETFLINEGKETLGFGKSEFHNAIRSAATIQKTDAFAVDHVRDNINSCAAARQLAIERFPSWDADSGEEGLEVIFAKQRVNHDKGIDLEIFSRILHSEYSEKLCKDLLMAETNLSGISEPSYRSTPRGENCVNILSGSFTNDLNLDEHELTLLKKMALSKIYFSVNKTTSTNADHNMLMEAELKKTGLAPERIQQLLCTLPSYKTQGTECAL